MTSRLLTGIVIVLMVTAHTAVAQAQPDNALQDAAAARMKAMGSGDPEGWGKYTTDDFIVIQADGSIKTKPERMAEIKATPTQAGSNTEQKWRTYGGNTAVSTALATIDGKPTRVTSIWVKQDGGWKVASVQLTTVTAAK